MDEENTSEQPSQESGDEKSFPWWVVIIILLILAGAVLWYLINFGIINIPSLSPKQEETTQTATESAVEPEPVLEVEPEPVETPVATESAEEVEEPEVSDEATDEAIKQAVLDRTGLVEEDVNFTITTKTANHAKGNIREIDAIGGAYWLAAKDSDGNWVAVYDGQANPPCAEIDPFNFSTDMVPECMDASNNLVTR